MRDITVSKAGASPAWPAVTVKARGRARPSCVSQAFVCCLGSVVPPLTRPQLAEARRVRAAELFEQGRSNAEIARVLGVSDESVRRWKRVWEKGGTHALRRRPATGRPSKLVTPRSSRCGPRWSKAPRRMASRPICGPWSGSAWWSSG
ncbi:helix-turn-helix domain-containing protein [Streptomyces smyrnaeus]|uniref:helix-turn-helix domain-containing protein n=1 Tax=Streptomyces smyrnaeus TaxID=1387713 RepID=UPI0033AFA3E6